jgi:hypothetical protein
MMRAVRGRPTRVQGDDGLAAIYIYCDKPVLSNLFAGGKIVWYVYTASASMSRTDSQLL